MKIISVVLFLVRKCRKKKEIKTPLSFNFFGNKTREESESKFYFLLFFLQFLSNQTAVFFHRKRRVVRFIFDIKPFLAARYAERRVVGLKKRIQELQSEMDIANAELEESKRSKDAAEQELKGYEVELAMNEEASIQTLEVRCSQTYPAIDWISSQIFC